MKIRCSVLQTLILSWGIIEATPTIFQFVHAKIQESSLRFDVKFLVWNPMWEPTKVEVEQGQLSFSNSQDPSSAPRNLFLYWQLILRNLRWERHWTDFPKDMLEHFQFEKLCIFQFDKNVGILSQKQCCAWSCFSMCITPLQKKENSVRHGEKRNQFSLYFSEQGVKQ